MGKITQNGVIFERDSENNPIIQKVIVERVISVPDSTLPEANRITVITGGEEKTALTLFSKREEITLTGQWQYLGNVSFKRADYEDSVTEFTAKVEYIIEVESVDSQATLKLFDYNARLIIGGSIWNSGVVNTGKIKYETGTLTMPTDSIIEIWGKKDAGSVSFLSAKIHIKKIRKV